MHSAPYFTAFGLLTILHAMRVIRYRREFHVSLGHGNHPDLERRIRVFGNHSEYVPLGLVFLIALEFVEAPIWFLHFCGVTLLAGRCLHAYGLGQGVSRARASGMVLTLISLLAASVGITLFAMIGNPL